MESYHGAEFLTEMIGQTFSKVVYINNSVDDFLRFIKENGTTYEFYYDHDCCAGCNIEDIVGNLQDLENSPLLQVEESSNRDDPPPKIAGFVESYTWTYYKFATIKGYVDVRWYGSSNGYYSESVSLRKLGGYGG